MLKDVICSGDLSYTGKNFNVDLKCAYAKLILMENALQWLEQAFLETLDQLEPGKSLTIQDIVTKVQCELKPQHTYKKHHEDVASLQNAFALVLLLHEQNWTIEEIATKAKCDPVVVYICAEVMLCMLRCILKEMGLLQPMK